ncbi:hypothetical protein [Citricoccus sp. I39-566]|nr:hypothetical protein [Citricoccus sp. I39-566]WMY78056.1 hypothetical protein RE421_14700 [Citricoccus sp. I39-566]
MPEENKLIKYRTEYVRRKRFSARQLQIAAIIALVVVIGILLAVILTGL